MSYELTHQLTQTTRTFSRQFWLKALELARVYGWKPLGTRSPPNFDFYKPIAEWDGRYLTNDGLSALCAVPHLHWHAGASVRSREVCGRLEQGEIGRWGKIQTGVRI